MEEALFLIHDLDQHEKHCLKLPRPARLQDPPLHYLVSFDTPSGTRIHHRVCITHETRLYEMTVRGRFVITK